MLSNAMINQFIRSQLLDQANCSEDGASCFWDQRVSLATWKPSLTFTPGDIPELQRPHLGSWLTVGCVQSNDPDWFVLGGGPKLSLWNKRAGRPTVVLEPKGQSPHWYPLVSKFVNAQVDPKIVAGGTSGSLVAWDFSGDQLFETCSLEDPPQRMTSVLTVIEVPRKESNLAGALLMSLNYLNDVYALAFDLKQTKPVHHHSSGRGRVKFVGKRRPSEKTFTGTPQAPSESSCADGDIAGESLVKTKSFNGVTRTIALDCEFVGVGFEGKDDALARVSVVNQFGHVILDTYVRPKEKITDYRTGVSGITPHHMRKGGPAKSFDAVQAQVSELCKDRILVGHAIHNDLRVLMLSHPKKYIRDTSRYGPFRKLFKGRYPSLKALSERILGVTIQYGAHDSVEDARATMRIYTMVKKVWEAQVKARRAGKSTQEIQRLSQHLHFLSTPEEMTGPVNKKLELTRLAKIALDVKSEFAPGTHRHDYTPRTVVQRKSGTLTMSSRAPDQVTVMSGRKCTKRRQRFLEKRRRIRRQKLVSQSTKKPSLFS
ncbi:RNA exonuclease 4 [Taenia solium]|eukprot:TsM_000447800 transcript=TsM_000447800 gene=TsM_000447800